MGSLGWKEQGIPGRPPHAANDNYNAAENVTLAQNAAHGVLSNDNTFGQTLTVYSVDGSTSSVSHSVNTGHGTLTLNADGSFTYVPQHNFVGVDDATFYVASDGIQQSNSATLQFVVAPGTLTASGTNVTASATTATGSIPVAHFTDSAGGVIDEYTAAVNWGDGATSGGDIASDGSGGWIVKGSHTYANSGSYSVSVAISSNVGGSASATATATVSPVNGGLSLTPSVDLPLEPGAPFNSRLAVLTDSWSGVNLSSITATVNWGDGSATQSANPSMTPASGSTPAYGGIFAGHTYASAGTFVITVTVNDGSGNTIHTSLNADVAPIRYVVPGVAGQTATVHFTVNKVGSSAAFDSTLGVFDVAATDASVNGITPGQSGYPSGALNASSSLALFRTDSPDGTSYDLSVPSGQTLSFYLVQNDTLANAKANNPNDLITGSPLSWFVSSAANPDGHYPHFRRVDNADGTVSYEVEDLAGGGDADFNDMIFTVSTAVAPPTPTATPGAASAALSWTASPGATGYKIYRGPSAGGENTTAIATVSATAGQAVPTTYSDTGLTPGVTYYYQVSDLANAIESPRGSELSVTIPVVPSAPASLTSAASGVDKITLTWPSVTGATTYKVYRGTSAGAESTTPIATGLTSPIFNDTSVTDGTTYFYKVTAVNAAGESTATSEASATAVIVPVAPQSPAASTIGAAAGEVALTWTAASEAASYNIYRGTTAGGESATPIATGVTATSFTDTGLTPGTTYYYTISAVNPAGQSVVSGEISGTPHAAVPTVATAAAGTVSSAGTTASLSVLGADEGGESALTYTWALTGTPPAAVTFAANGTNAAKAATATFSKTGTYNFQVTITNGTGASTNSAVSVAVPQILTALTVSSVAPTVTSGTTRQFTASGVDQFGAAIPTASLPAITFSLAPGGSGGTITSGGVYTAPTATADGNDTIVATSGSVTSDSPPVPVVTTSDVAPPPTNVHAESTPEGALVSWDGSYGQVYTILRSTDGGQTFVQLSTSGYTFSADTDTWHHSYDDTTLAAGASAQYEITTTVYDNASNLITGPASSPTSSVTGGDGAWVDTGFSETPDIHSEDISYFGDQNFGPGVYRVVLTSGSLTAGGINVVGSMDHLGPTLAENGVAAFTEGGIASPETFYHADGTIGVWTNEGSHVDFTAGAGGAPTYQLQRLTTLSLTATDVNRTTDTVTVPNSNMPQDLYVPMDTYGGATVNLHVTAGAGSQTSDVLYTATSDVTGAVFSDGNLGQDKGVHHYAVNSDYNFTIAAGFDNNKDLVLESTEVSRTVHVHMFGVKFTETYSDQFRDDARVNGLPSGVGGEHARDYILMGTATGSTAVADVAADITNDSAGLRAILQFSIAPIADGNWSAASAPPSYSGNYVTNISGNAAGYATDVVPMKVVVGIDYNKDAIFSKSEIGFPAKIIVSSTRFGFRNLPGA